MPGRCPSCNQTYADETLSFCPNDGTPLVKDAAKPYDPQATMIAQPPPNYPPQQPPQGGYYAPPGGQAPPPPQGGQQPPPGWQQQPPYGQQPPPYGQQQYAPQYGTGGAAKSKMPLILAIAGVVVIGGAIALFFALRGNSSSSSSSSSSRNDNSSSTRNTSTSSTSSTPSTTSSFPTPSTSTTTTTTTGSTYTEDEKYRVFFAAAKTGDTALQTEIAKKIGIIDSNGAPTSYYDTFIKGAGQWALRDAAWVQQHNTPDAAREYVESHR